MNHRLLSAGIPIIAVIALGASAAAQTQLWIRQFGTSVWDKASALCPDGAGGAFVAGETYGSLGGPVAGVSDAWLARYDSAGNQTWVRQFGTSTSDGVSALCPDGAGGAFVTGYTSGSLAGSSAGAGDVWLARYDSAGNQTWIRQFGTSTTDNASALCPDGAGGAFVAGYTEGSLGGPNAGAGDAWLARYDSAGNQTWIRQFGTSGYEQANELCPDGAGGAFAAGNTGGNLGGPNAGGDDAWLARYDSAGNQTWIRQFGTSTDDYADALCPDGAGGAFAAGWTWGSLGGPSAGYIDAWLARYDSAGNRTWIRQFGTSVHDSAWALCPDGAGGAFAAGPTEGSLGGGPNAGGNDAWLARYDSAGNRTWIRQLGSSGHDFPNALCPDGAGGAFAAGGTSGSLAGPNAGEGDAWLARYTDTCYPDCTADGALTVADFGCFQTKFVAADPYADCNGDGQRTVADFGCFQTKFVSGCP